MDWQNGLWDVDRHAYYHQHQYISHSTLEEFRASAPWFHGRYIAKTIEAEPPTGPMEFGNALHAALFEPGRPNGYHVGPNCGRTAKDFKAFQANHGGDHAPCITFEEAQTLQGMLMAIGSNEMARDLLKAPGLIEQPIRWKCTETGLWCRAKIDKIIQTGKFILDLKSCRDPSPQAFAKDVASFAYHRQAAMYLDGLKACGYTGYTFWFLVAGKEPPYDCAFHEIQARDIYRARRDNLNELHRLKKCYETGDWSYRHGAEVNVISVPPWGFSWE